MNKTKTDSLYSEAQKERDIDAIIVAAENTVSNFAAVAALAKRWEYPPTATSDLLNITDELCNQMFLLANFIQNPAAAGIVNDLVGKKSKMEMELLSAADPADFLID